MMTNFKIESGIPLVDKRKPLGSKFPFGAMQVGDSFLLNGERPSTVGYMAAVFARRQSPKWKFVVRKVEDGHHRCWRVL